MNKGLFRKAKHPFHYFPPRKNLSPSFSRNPGSAFLTKSSCISTSSSGTLKFLPSPSHLKFPYIPTLWAPMIKPLAHSSRIYRLKHSTNPIHSRTGCRWASAERWWSCRPSGPPGPAPWSSCSRASATRSASGMSGASPISSIATEEVRMARGPLPREECARPFVC